MSNEDIVLSELQLLISMYDPSQYHFDDPEVALRVENGLPISGSISLTIKLNEFLQLSLRLPEGYPSTERLSASCQCQRISSSSTSSNIVPGDKVQSQLNNELSSWLKLTKPGESSLEEDGKNILGVVNWMNERWENISAEEAVHDENLSCIKTEEKAKKCRIWIHSHHIYNEKKRKFIIDTANGLDLTGFSLPGKPGFICVEGESANCDDFWSRTRQLSWQKISLVERQILKESEPQTFSTFEELRLDMSGFMRYLEEKRVSSVIKGYLGFG